MRFFLILSLFLFSVIGCSKSKNTNDDDTKESRSSILNDEGNSSFDFGVKLNRAGKWSESNRYLLKDYSDHDGKVAVTCFYLFLNYGMTGDDKKAKKYLDEAFARDFVGDELKKAKDSKKYSRVFEDKELESTIENYLKMPPPP